jgi:hypothetical protein
MLSPGVFGNSDSNAGPDDSALYEPRMRFDDIESSILHPNFVAKRFASQYVQGAQYSFSRVFKRPGQESNNIEDSHASTSTSVLGIRLRLTDVDCTKILYSGL